MKCINEQNIISVNEMSPIVQYMRLIFRDINGQAHHFDLNETLVSVTFMALDDAVAFELTILRIFNYFLDQ